MNTGIKIRLSALEKNMSRCPAPTREEWWKKWREMSELDKSIYIVEAENLEELKREPQFYRYMKTIAGYLFDMGLLDPNAKTLREIAAEMDERILRENS